MLHVRTKIAEDGGIVIPVEYLQVLGIQVGDEIILRLEDGVLRIFTLFQAIENVQELVRPYVPEGRSLSEELIEERRQED
ncbi:MAG TPA: AbrB/MazE/SpoVT family DNA-binding domain-containing protein [Ktedonobacteraceae bacterium]|nr:AbrB/MazE/SpoVT family DNA-binding domain-containing protein [Ktedonobacteraceae bacterium]